MTTESNPWILYSTQAPATAGIYEWRLPTKRVPGAFVTFYGHMRMRGAGYREMLSPAFDYWDGYRVLLPAGVEWRAAPSDAKCKNYEYTNLAIEGLSFAACPYCQKIPVLAGFERSGGGMMVGPGPHEMNSFELRCCSWGSSPSMADPREIERIRQAAFAIIRGN